ncbi:hypothetical protein PRUPE_2G011800 [Prunus persica]|uniref:Uncharacterized protein n=1 Tax=Prunus persica TaxID=3760 RepID=A0A251Q958_PRUPE|nr:hypothetical protein PRUPE_2G011800 [Prunus persica]
MQPLIPTYHSLIQVQVLQLQVRSHMIGLGDTEIMFSSKELRVVLVKETCLINKNTNHNIKISVSSGK